MATLLEKIKKHDAKVAVIGIGYVGLPLCVEMAKAGFHTTGYDKHDMKVNSVLAGKSYIGDISDDVLAPLVQSGKLTASLDRRCSARRTWSSSACRPRSTRPRSRTTASSCSRRRT
jgi:UDP-N-acetyl-D-mannosaminuronate dehydrogenase